MTTAEKLHLYTEMVRIRRFNAACQKRYCWGKMGGFLCLSNGQEATPALVRSIMGEDDHTITGPRGLAAAVAAGIPLGSLMAELYGKPTGCCRGKGGMFSFFSPAHRHWGCHATAAAQTPLAAGLAYALKYQAKQGVVFCFLGDGSINQGVFHETLNLVSLWDIPVVFILENNWYSMGTSVKRSSAFNGHLASRAEGYRIKWDIAYGWDIENLRVRLIAARAHAIGHSRPTLLEVYTYRFHGFTVADANSKRYRTAKEIEGNKKHRDPITKWARLLWSEDLLNHHDKAAIDRAANLEVQHAVRFAEASPAPDPELIQQHVYSQTNDGRHFF